MTNLPSLSSDDTLPSGRVVRWVMLGAVILFSIGLYFQYGTQTPPLGIAPAATSGATTTETP